MKKKKYVNSGTVSGGSEINFWNKFHHSERVCACVSEHMLKHACMRTQTKPLITAVSCVQLCDGKGNDMHSSFQMSSRINEYPFYTRAN